MREAHGGTEGRVMEGKERQRNSNLDLDATDFGKKSRTQHYRSALRMKGK